MGVDTGAEQVALAGDLLLPSAVEGSFSTGKDLTLDSFLYYRGTVAADLGYDPNVFEAGESIVH